MRNAQPKLEDIAIASGFSTATVSRVVNHPEMVKATTRQTVVQKMRELGAGIPATQTLGLIVPDSSNPFFSQLIYLFERELARFGAQLISASADGRLDREIDLIDRFRAMGVGGIFYTPTRSGGEAVLQLVARGDIPILAFDRQVTVGNLDCVTSSSRNATQMLIDYLLNHGHERFGYIAGADGTTTADERAESFERALGKNGIVVKTDWVFPGNYRAPSGRDAAEAFLVMDPNERPTAICAANDLMAIGFMQRVMQAGLRVPTDVSVAGFDGIEEGMWYHPSLTTIAQPRARLVHEATALLLKRIATTANCEELPQTTVTVEPELIFRDSVGPAPTRANGRPRLVPVSSYTDSGP